MAGRHSLCTPETVEAICDRLANGEGLAAICRDDAMPCVRAVHNWMNADPAIDAQIMRAREVGMLVRAERAIEDAKAAEDAPLGRLAFDAERWYIGKLSNAFSDDKTKRHELTSPDGSMTPKGLDVSKLSDAVLREITEAAGATDPG